MAAQSPSWVHQRTKAAQTQVAFSLQVPCLTQLVAVPANPHLPHSQPWAKETHSHNPTSFQTRLQAPQLRHGLWRLEATLTRASLLGRRDFQQDFRGQSVKKWGHHCWVNRSQTVRFLLRGSKCFVTTISRKGESYTATVIAVDYISPGPRSSAGAAEAQSCIVKHPLVHNELLAAVVPVEAIACCFCWGRCHGKGSSADSREGRGVYQDCH